MPKVSPSRRRKPALHKLAELSLAVPQVVSHRVARMAAAGPWPGARDRREFHTMGAEKVAAFGESWWAMLAQLWRSQMSLALSMSTAWWSPGRRPTASTAWWSRPSPQVWQRWAQGSFRALEDGLAPVHRRAVANAKRLGRVKP
jgi:hypothetical protein